MTNHVSLVGLSYSTATTKTQTYSHYKDSDTMANLGYQD